MNVFPLVFSVGLLPRPHHCLWYVSWVYGLFATAKNLAQVELLYFGDYPGAFQLM